MYVLPRYISLRDQKGHRLRVYYWMLAALRWLSCLVAHEVI